MKLTHLSPGPGWPKGWWIADRAYLCTGTRCGHRLSRGRTVYLSGTPGYVYCEKHAPEAGRAALAEAEGRRKP